MAFVIDVFARRIVDWRVSSSMRADLVLDALEQALYDRKPDHNALIHHSDRLELATLEWGSRFNTCRLLGPIGYCGAAPR